MSGRKRNAISWAFAEAINELYLAVRRASDEERQALRAHIDSLTMTNCWWAEYEAAPVIRNALDGKHWWAECEAAPVEQLQKIRLHQDDVLVVKLDYHVDTSTERAYSEILGRVFPDNKVVILQPGQSVEVITNNSGAADDGPAATP